MWFGRSGWNVRDSWHSHQWWKKSFHKKHHNDRDDDEETGGDAGNNGGPTAIVGDQFDNVLIGTELADVINALQGNDSVTGGGGDDIINGDAGDDTLDGGAGNDVIRGGAGNDSIIGGDGDDQLYGGEGSDRIRGRDGDDVIEGGKDDGTTTALDSVFTLVAGGRVEEIDPLTIGEAGAFLRFGATDRDVSALTFVGRLDDGDAVFVVNNANDNPVTWTVAGPGGSPSFTISLTANQSAVLNVGDVATGDAFTVTAVTGAGPVPDPASAGDETVTLIDRYLVEGGDRVSGGEGADTFIYSRGDGSDEIIDFEVGVDKLVIKGYQAKNVTLVAGDDIDETVILFSKPGDKDDDFGKSCGWGWGRDDGHWGSKYGHGGSKFGGWNWKHKGSHDDDKDYGFEQNDAILISDVVLTIDDLTFG